MSDFHQSMLSKLHKYAEQNSWLQFLIIFGSYAHNRARSDSDIDLAIAGRQALTTNTKISAQQDLERFLQKEVDLVDLWDARGAILQESMEQRQVVYSRNPELYARFLLRMWRGTSMPDNS